MFLISFLSFCRTRLLLLCGTCDDRKYFFVALCTGRIKVEADGGDAESSLVETQVEQNGNSKGIVFLCARV